MTDHDPLDQARGANPVDPRELPGAPAGMADGIVRRRWARRATGPSVGLAAMAFVLVVGAVATAVMMRGMGPAVTGTPDTTVVDSGQPTTSVPTETTTTTIAPDDGTLLEAGTAPWSESPLSGSVVPRHLIEDWETADNRTWCSALYPAGSPDDAAISRPAEFGGGWAVAWDLPDGPGRFASGEYCPDCGRGAFGVAGVGIAGGTDDLGVWPNQIEWEDGSRAGYGREGLAPPGSGAPLLSYLLVEGQGCLYNVWSFLGEEHLVALLGSLRFVDGMQAEPVELADRAGAKTRAAGPAPWDRPALDGPDVPTVFFEEWEDLGTTACPMMAFADLEAEGAGATARRALGDGALIVAWDLSTGPGRYASGDYCAGCGRGAFGTSLEESGGVQDHRTTGNPTLSFDDGSAAWIFPELSYGLPDDRIVHIDPETGEPAPEAYRAIILVAGRPECVYQVWSSYGPDHVERLVANMRLVEF